MNIHIWLIIFAIFTAMVSWIGMCFKRDSESGKVRFHFEPIKKWWWLPIALFIVFELGHWVGNPY